MLTESGKIYHQGSLSSGQCEDADYIRTVGLRIAKEHKDPNSVIKVNIWSIFVCQVYPCGSVALPLAVTGVGPWQQVTQG